jgi:uncharacterized phage protein (TIGR01671 family)
MSRVIKFRVWDKLQERFTRCDEGYQGHYVLSLKGEYHNLQNGSGGKEYIVQQWTGLTDKNGVGIYEGDILSIYNHPLAEQVEYELDGSSFGFFAHDDVDRQHGTWEYLSDWTSAAGYDVIGNIFENSELLEA